MAILNLPTQKLSYRQKTTGYWGSTNRPWGELCVDNCIKGVHVNQNWRRTNYKTKQRNYNLFNNRINESDFEYVTKPFEILDKNGRRLDLKFPATLQPYDIISPYFRLLFGEEAKRFFSPVIRVVNEQAISEKEKMEKEVLMNAVTEILAASMDPNSQETPEEILKYQTSSIQDIREEQANNLIEYYKRYLNLDQVFQQGWKDFLIAGEEIYRIEEVAGEPKITRVNPTEIFFLLPNNSNIIDNADVIVEHNRMSLSQIIDEYYEFLTPSQIDELEAMYPSTGAPFTEYAPLADVMDNLPVVDSIHSLSNYNGTGLDVYRVRWKSFKKVGSFHYFDENGEEQEISVDETFKKDPNDAQSWVEWFWVNEYWEGTRIGNHLYLNIRPLKFRFSKGNNLSKCNSGYVGTLCDADNSMTTSLMDRAYPWVVTYLIMWYRTELLMAANQGQIAMIDVSLIPDGWDISQWMYYATAMKFGFINSYNEGVKGERKGQFNQSNQNKTLDLEVGNSIQHHIELLRFLEEKLRDTLGITPQRLGAIAQDELVGNTERAVVQSSHITEGYFYTHNYTKIRVLEHLLEVAKEGLAGKSKTIQYVTDDVQTMLATIDGDMLSSADYGIFISNSAKDQEALADIKKLLQAALQNDKIQMSQVVDVYNSQSIAVLKRAFRDAEMQMAKQAQANEEAQRAHEKELHDSQIEMQDRLFAHEDMNKQLDRENKIEVEQIKSFMGQTDQDINDNQIPDQVEVAKLALERSRLEFERMQSGKDSAKEDKKIALEREKLRVQERMKDKDNATKIKVAKLKPKPKPASKK